MNINKKTNKKTYDFFSIIILDLCHSSFAVCVLLVSYHKYYHYFSDNRKGTNDSVVSIVMPITHEGDTLDIILSISQLHQQLYHPAAQDRSPTEAKQG